jgi:hypothetical protein
MAHRALSAERAPATAAARASVARRATADRDGRRAARCTSRPRACRCGRRARRCARGHLRRRRHRCARGDGARERGARLARRSLVWRADDADKEEGRERDDARLEREDCNAGVAARLVEERDEREGEVEKKGSRDEERRGAGGGCTERRAARAARRPARLRPGGYAPLRIDREGPEEDVEGGREESRHGRLDVRVHRAARRALPRRVARARGERASLEHHDRDETLSRAKCKARREVVEERGGARPREARRDALAPAGWGDGGWGGGGGEWCVSGVEWVRRKEED